MSWDKVEIEVGIDGPNTHGEEGLASVGYLEETMLTSSIGPDLIIRDTPGGILRKLKELGFSRLETQVASLRRLAGKYGFELVD